MSKLNQIKKILNKEPKNMIARLMALENIERIMEDYHDKINDESATKET